MMNPPDRKFVTRIIRFFLTGLLTTALTYILFMLLIAHMHYTIAAVGTWIPVTAIGFMVNRQFTFRISGPAHLKRQFAFYLTGSILQLVVSLAGYATLFEIFSLEPTPAFFTNLVVTTAFSFTFMNMVTFR